MYTVPIPESIFSEQTRSRIGEAVYLLGYLIQRSNWESGVTHVTLPSISEATGLPIRTVERWMRVLRENEYVSTRRTAFGTLVTIANYEPISRTRGVKHNPPKVAASRATNPPSVAAGCVSDPPAPVMQPAAGGGGNPPNAAARPARSGLSNIREIPSPNRISSLQKPSSSSTSGPDAPACGHREGNGKEAAEDILDSMTDQQRAELRMQTLERMANSGLKFWTTFVRRTESGGLDTYDKDGEIVVRSRMLEAIREMIAAGESPPGAESACVAGFGGMR